MKKSLFVLAGILVFASPAFAYELPGPVNAPVELGAGEVDFSKPSVVTGTFTVDRFHGRAWITAGDVAHEKTGYGFYVYDDMLYGVSNTGGTSFNLPLGFVRPNQPITVRAAYTPGDGIRFDTQWQAADWGQYSRGIIQGTLPNSSIRGLGALFGVATNVDLVVGGWSYTQ